MSFFSLFFFLQFFFFFYLYDIAVVFLLSAVLNLSFSYFSSSPPPSSSFPGLLALVQALDEEMKYFCLVFPKVFFLMMIVLLCIW